MTDQIKTKKENKAEKEIIKASESEVKKEIKLTDGFLKSKANYTIPVKIDGRQTFIPPFGKIKAIKEKLQFDSNDAKNLTFIKA